MANRAYRYASDRDDRWTFPHERVPTVDGCR